MRLPDAREVLSARRGREGREIGRSREDRPIVAHRFGSGPLRVSLLGGCHADEPVGPRLLRHLVGWLGELPGSHPALRDVEWWILPHLNPDGAARNRAWQHPDAGAYRLTEYLAHVVREGPGDDVEFGFPRGPGDREARPENRAARRWWRSAEGPFHLHASLHGMAVGRGPWFLLDRAWADRSDDLQDACRRASREMGYRVHDEDRGGEKGFRRISEGFSTRPDSRAMRDHFLERGDEETARRFRPSSMETMRELGEDALTLVPEMPLFLVDGPADANGTPGGGTGGEGEGAGDGSRGTEAVTAAWKARWRDTLEGWARELRSGAAEPGEVTGRARERGVSAMPVRDQMILQWTFVRAGLEAVRRAAGV